MSKRTLTKGGTRQNAGRKPGVPNKDRRKAIAKAERGGIMPLALMLETMRTAWAKGQALTAENKDLEANDYFKAAHERARDAAPYLHPRLQSITQKDERLDLSKLTDEELEFLRRIKLKGSEQPQP